jgi:hypothetical protein
MKSVRDDFKGILADQLVIVVHVVEQRLFVTNKIVELKVIVDFLFVKSLLCKRSVECFRWKELGSVGKVKGTLWRL